LTDFKQIDSFFNGDRAFEEKDRPQISRRAKILHFLKVAMPSAAAVLVAGVLLWPTFKKETVIADFDMTLPKKGELEKLHIEQSSFAVTDKNNKVSTLTADQVDETETGSNVMKIINPKGDLPLGDQDERVKIDSEIGYFDQKANTVRSEKNVKAVTSQGTTVLTESADYDFNKAYGKGDKDVYAFGDWGKLKAEGFEYHQTNDLLILNGKSTIFSENRIVRADRQIRYYRRDNRIEADGNVRIEENDNVLYADKMIAFLTDNKAAEIKKAEAYGNVRIVTPKGTAFGDEGMYLPATNDIELIGNVKLEQNGNIIYGAKAVTNLETSITHVLADQESAKRVSGVIRGQTIKEQKNEKK
jgi:lipopolysaccharide transport protein LptA